MAKNDRTRPEVKVNEDRTVSFGGIVLTGAQAREVADTLAKAAEQAESPVAGHRAGDVFVSALGSVYISDGVYLWGGSTSSDRLYSFTPEAFGRAKVNYLKDLSDAIRAAIIAEAGK